MKDEVVGIEEVLKVDEVTTDDEVVVEVEDVVLRGSADVVVVECVVVEDDELLREELVV